MAETKDIFISYSNANKEKVSKIVTAIEYFGCACWFQLNDSKQQYIEEINYAINHSLCFVVFLSNASMQSLMVRNEISRAIYQNQKNSHYAIVPVVIEELTPENDEIAKLYLGSINWLLENQFTDYESLVLAIFEQANITPVHDESMKSTYSTQTEVERLRLKAQNRFFNAYATKYLDEVFAKYDNPNVLDIGCDNGDNILMRLEGRNYAFLMGIDHNEDSIAQANAMHASQNTVFTVCDVVSNDFFRVIFSQMQKNKISGFDIIHISSVLLHLGKIDSLPKDLYMLLNDGGTIFIQDEDDGVNMAYPYSKFFEDCFYIWHHSKESGDRHMARKLPIALKNAGFSQIKIFSTAMTSIDFDGKYKEELWDLYFNTDLWATDNASYFDNLEAFQLLEMVTQKHKEMKQAYMNDEYFVMLGVFFITATK